MTRIILAALALFAVQAQAQSAAPRIGADVPSPAGDTATQCRFVFGGITAPLVTPIAVDNANGIAASKFRMCVATAAGALVGTNNVSVALMNAWGEVGPDSSPFALSRPPAPTVAPTGTRLLP